ncbi:MAG TPA: recombinase family protein, partial [Steroidobacteraceae bacterium]
MNKQPTRYVTYYRVSTERQGRSGLGLEAQRAAVEAFMHSNGPRSELASFTEVESGKRADRPELAKALQRCRQTHATLLVAKLDRLSRDAAFLLTLQQGAVRFICADMPEANEAMIGFM